MAPDSLNNMRSMSTGAPCACESPPRAVRGGGLRCCLIGAAIRGAAQACRRGHQLGMRSRGAAECPSVPVMGSAPRALARAQMQYTCAAWRRRRAKLESSSKGAPGRRSAATRIGRAPYQGTSEVPSGPQRVSPANSPSVPDGRRAWKMEPVPVQRTRGMRK